MSKLLTKLPNVTAAQTLRRHLNKALRGPNWDALIASIATGDEYLASLARYVFDQSFLRSATGKYLKMHGSNVGAHMPEGVGIGEEAYRELIVTLSNKKLTTESLLSVLELFFGVDATRAFAQTNAPENYALKPFDDLLIEVDGTIVTVVFDPKDFSLIQSASALEVAVAITKTFKKLGLKAYAEPYTDPSRGNKTFLRIYSGAPGLKGSVTVLGGRAQNSLLFGESLPVEAEGLWSITRQDSPNRVRYSWMGDPNTKPLLALLKEGDYANIYADSVLQANKGSKKVLSSTYDWFEVESDSFEEQLTVGIEEGGIVFYRPEKRTVQSASNPAIVAIVGDTVHLQIPSTSQIVERNKESAGYLAKEALLRITKAERDTDGRLTIETENPHFLEKGNTVFIDGLQSVSEIAQSKWAQKATPLSYLYGTADRNKTGDVLTVGDKGGTSGFALFRMQDSKWIALDNTPEVRSSGMLTEIAALQDGRFFVVDDSHAWVFDPNTLAWIKTTLLPYPRGDGKPSITLLRDGRVLVWGGSGEPAKKAMFFDPRTEHWEEAATEVSSRWNHGAVLLDDGSVFVIGDIDGSLKETVIFYPANKQIVTLGTSHPSLGEHYTVCPTILRRESGESIVVANPDGFEVYNPSTRTQEIIPAPYQLTEFTRINRLSDGRILLITAPELPGPVTVGYYNPTDKDWQTEVPPPAPFTLGHYKGIVTLPDNSALVLSSASEAASWLLEQKERFTTGGGRLNGRFTVKEVVSSTKFVVETDIRLATTLIPANATISYLNEEEGGAFIYSENGPAITEINTKLTNPLYANKPYSSIEVEDASLFPDEAGYLCFAFGTSKQVSQIRYINRPHNSLLVFDKPYIFPHTIEKEASVTLLASKKAWEPEEPQKLGALIATAATAGRVAAQKTIEQVVAAGTAMETEIKYPGTKGLIENDKEWIWGE